MTFPKRLTFVSIIFLLFFSFHTAYAHVTDGSSAERKTGDFTLRVNGLKFYTFDSLTESDADLICRSEKIVRDDAVVVCEWGGESSEGSIEDSENEEPQNSDPLETETSSGGLQITSENLPAGNIPTPGTTNYNSDVLGYSTTLTYAGGTGTPVWSLVEEEGRLPYGVTLDKNTGVISGSLYRISAWGVSGTYYFTVKLTVGSDVATKRLSIPMNSYVVASANQIKILTKTLPAAVVGKPYSATIAVNPEVGVSDNSLFASGVLYTNFQKIPGFPEGLVIDKKTGVISGIPVRVGTTSFYVTAHHKQGQGDGSTDYMYYTIPVASSLKTTKLVSFKTVMRNGRGVVNNGVVTDVNTLASTANFSDGSLVGQKIVWRRVGEMRNRVQGSQSFYCFKKYSPWSNEGAVPGIIVKDLASKSFPATKVHTYGIEFQITSPGLYEFAAYATSNNSWTARSTFKASPHKFVFVKPYTTQGDLSQSEYIALPEEQRNIPSTCDVQEQASSAVAVNTFEEEVNNGWGVTFPTSLSDVKSTLASAMASPQASGGVNANLSCVALHINMHRGAESVSVSSLQNFLAQKGFFTEAPTGFFGDLTVNAVKAYQASKGISQTGMVYELTRAAIKSESCR